MQAFRKAQLVFIIALTTSSPLLAQIAIPSDVTEAAPKVGENARSAPKARSKNKRRSHRFVQAPANAYDFASGARGLG